MRARPGLEGRRGCGRPVGWAWSWRWCLLFCCGDENKPGVEEAEASLAQGEVPAAGRCGCDRWSASTSASLDEGAGWGGVPPPLGRAGRCSASWFGHLSSGRVWAHHAELPGEGGWCPRGDGPGNHIPHQHLRGLSHRQSSEETSRLWQSQLLAVAHSDRVPLRVWTWSQRWAAGVLVASTAPPRQTPFTFCLLPAEPGLRVRHTQQDRAQGGAAGAELACPMRSGQSKGVQNRGAFVFCSYELLLPCYVASRQKAPYIERP